MPVSLLSSAVSIVDNLRKIWLAVANCAVLLHYRKHISMPSRLCLLGAGWAGSFCSLT